MHATWHAADDPNVVRHVPCRTTHTAWAAYAAFFNVSSTKGARSSAKPPGSASHALGVSIAAHTSEIVPEWKCLNGLSSNKLK